MLSSNLMILQAICDGGYAANKEEPESDPENEKKDGDGDFENERSENKLVQSILSKQSVSDSNALTTLSC